MYYPALAVYDAVVPVLRLPGTRKEDKLATVYASESAGVEQPAVARQSDEIVE